MVNSKVEIAIDHQRSCETRAFRVSSWCCYTIVGAIAANVLLATLAAHAVPKANSVFWMAAGMACGSCVLLAYLRGIELIVGARRIKRSGLFGIDQFDISYVDRVRWHPYREAVSISGVGSSMTIPLVLFSGPDQLEIVMAFRLGFSSEIQEDWETFLDQPRLKRFRGLDIGAQGPPNDSQT